MDSLLQLFLNLLPILSFGSCILFIFVVIILLTLFSAKKFLTERQSIIDYCNKNGLSFSDVLSKGIPIKCKDFKVINKGRQNKFNMVIAGNRNNIDFDVATYIYTDYDAPKKGKFLGMEVTTYSGPKHRHDYYGTICILHNDDLKLPHFFIRDEIMILDTFGKVLGGQDINFNDDPTFSKKFVLQGVSEGKVREFFNQKIRSSFVQLHKKGYVYEGFEDYLFVFAPKEMDINGKMNLLADSIKILNPLLEVSRS